MSNEIVLTDLGGLCKPSEHISDFKEIFKWNRIPYKTDEYEGSMLVSTGTGRPEPVLLPLNVSGWHRIYVGVASYGAVLPGSCYVSIRLTGDEAVMHLCTSTTDVYAAHSVEESYLLSADLTGRSIEFSKPNGAGPCNSIVAWVRLVPMTEEEIADYRREQARTDTKRLYATNDMHGMFWLYGLREKEEWKTIVQEYAESDVEWFSMENVSIYDGSPSTGNPDNFIFFAPGDKTVQENLQKYLTMDMFSSVVDYGHRRGLKICESIRMGGWGIEFPDDQKYFDNQFFQSHQELRCVDRDGTCVDALSYVYPEVRDYMLNKFRSMAMTGCDAVEMIFNRGVPYVLFEEPTAELFRERFGEDMRLLPQDDPRVTEIRCGIMTGFVRELRKMLDEISPDRRIRLHARTQFSIWDAKHVGEDLVTWAKEGLIDAIISYPQRVREVLDGDVWQDGDREKIDLDKYTRYYRERPESMIYRRQDFNFMPPMEDSHGIPRGPRSQEERIAEFMELEEKYGVTFYAEIMPRAMSTEQYRDRALELYRAGCRHISMWDTYGRVPRKAEWSMMRRLGHMEELSSFDSGEGKYFRTVRILHVGGKDVGRYKPAWGG